MRTEVSSSVPHFLQVGLSLSPITYRCLLKVLCPVRRPITTLDCVLLKGNNRALVARSGPEINSRACLCVLQGPRHNTKMLVFYPAFYLSSYILPRDPKERLGSNKPLNRTVPCELVGDFISSHSGMPRDPNTAPQCIWKSRKKNRDIAMWYQEDNCFCSMNAAIEVLGRAHRSVP